MKELFEIVELRSRRPDLPFCLATVMSVNGSSYRRPGARMLVDAHGRVGGSVSGGCLEKDVISRCHRVLLNQIPELVIYDTTDQDDWAFGTSLGCEGRIQILIEPLLPGVPWLLGEAVKEARAHRKSRFWSTLCEPLEGFLPQGKESPMSYPVRLTHPTPGEPASSEPAAKGKPVSRELTEPPFGLLLTERLSPGSDLILLGGGWDAPPLVSLGKELGYRVLVVDRRNAFAQASDFPQADEVLCLPAPNPDGKTALSLNEDAAVVVMNHHYETDKGWLAWLAGRALGYLGVLGPKKRTARIISELKEAGLWDLPRGAEERIHGPAGLDIGSETPEEIALAILAEIQAVKGGRSGASLKDKQRPIHAN
jgi:xanthine/CO dehydrogenase XdhC/CoxF family maturation factor